ncbi:MAG TPA: MMPL family transporter [Thermoguttaceae bacterium]|nr:MMPL family transporter [Thermoguttaceae bacterium]
MTAERTPAAESSFLAGPLGWFTRGVLRYPVAVLALAIALTVLAALFTVKRLEFHTNRLDLLDPRASHNRLWIEYINEFGHQDDVVVVVQGADRRQVVPVLEELSSDLIRENGLFHAVLHQLDLSKIRSKGLYYLKPEQLMPIEPFLAEVRPIINGQWARLNVSNMFDEACLQLHDPRFAYRREATLATMDRLSSSLLTALTQPGSYHSPWPEMPAIFESLSEPGSIYFLTNEGRWGLILLRLVPDGEKGAFAPGSKAIDELRRLTARAETRYPGVKIGLTGLPVLENDEMRTSQSAMTWAGVLSFFGVVCLFVAGFGGVRHPLMAGITLGIAMIWSFGYITLAIGHLNILSIAFASIVIGLGDFGVHYVARYLQNRVWRLGVNEALVDTSRSVGPSIVTGGVATAASFFLAGFTDFRGVAELGVIAGGGILLCCAATFIVLPAMIRLCDARRTYVAMPEPLDVDTWLRPLFTWPRLVVVASTVGTIALGVGLVWLRYDHNLLHLQAKGLESVELEKALLEKADQSAWFALSIAKDAKELQKRKEAFLKMPSIDRVEDISTYLPLFGYEQKRPIIERIRRQLDGLPERPPEIPVDPPDQLGQALARAHLLVGVGPQAERIQHQLAQARNALRGMTQQECYERLRRFQHGMAGDLLSRLFQLRGVTNPEPPKFDDLPESLVTRLVSHKDQGDLYLMKVYSKSDIWNMEEMQRFVEDVRTVDKKATGNPLQTYEASRRMKASYENTAWYALGVIVVILFLDFRSLRYTLLAMLPLGIGLIQFLGIMGLLDIPLNPANMIVLPLILGIGVDNGVHVLHDFRRQRSGPYRMTPSTANAILVCSLTNIVGFGSLMIASHQGLQSLGRVLTLSMSCCLFASLVMLPALLAWATRRRQVEPDAELDRGDPRKASGHGPYHVPLPHRGTSPHAVPEMVRREPAERAAGR